MLDYYGGDLRRLFNTAGADYRELGLKSKLVDLSQAATFELLASRGNLVKRPFLIGDSFGLIGFKEPDWEKAFAL